MLRVVISFFLLLASQSFALDLSKMSDKERALFQNEIRLYILENPEIIMEAVEVLRQKEQQAAIQKVLSLETLPIVSLEIMVVVSFVISK